MCLVTIIVMVIFSVCIFISSILFCTWRENSFSRSLKVFASDNRLLDAKVQVFGLNSILDMTKPLKMNIIVLTMEMALLMHFSQNGILLNLNLKCFAYIK